MTECLSPLKTRLFVRLTLAFYLVLLGAAVQPVLGQPTTGQKPGKLTPEMTPSTTSATPGLTREEWGNQLQTHRERKRALLLQIKQYVESGEVHPLAFIDSYSELSKGPVRIVEYETYRQFYISKASQMLESILWQSNSKTGKVHMFTLKLQPGRPLVYFGTHAPIEECFTDEEVTSVYSPPRWRHEDVRRIVIHTSSNERVFTLVDGARPNFRPTFTILRSGCVFFLGFDF